MLKVWYYRPFGYDKKPETMDLNFVVDAKGRRFLDKNPETKEQHPLDKIYQRRISSSMVEVPRD